jgi:hypothetical protein
MQSRFRLRRLGRCTDFLDNSRTVGVEVIARDDKDVTPAQVQSSRLLADSKPAWQSFAQGSLARSKYSASFGEITI